MELPNQRGVGRIINTSRGCCEVSIFHSIGQKTTETFPRGALNRAFLAPQTRVYIENAENTQIGRVVDWSQEPDRSISYLVKFAKGRKADLAEQHINVRLWSTPEEPVETFISGGADSQYLHDRRQTAMTSLQRLNSAAKGLTAIISASIDLVPHQIAVVKRVLDDPVQRYLLADEVGLGKTIEAGLIVRQHLIDDRSNRVLFSVPTPLVEQWKDELDRKLKLYQFGDSISVISHEAISSIDEDFPLIVVDEAHHLVGDVSDELCSSARRLREISKPAKLLLLLSATPPAGDEFVFLSLLNLLDPGTHPVDDISAFKAVLEQQRKIGRVLLGLDPTAPKLVLRQWSSELMKLYPNDTVIQEVAPQVIAASRGAIQELPALCGALKSHVADCYRVNNRVIRSRRTDCKGWEFQNRGPQSDGKLNFTHICVEEDDCDGIESLMEALEDWRYEAVNYSLENLDAQRALIARYRLFLSTIANDIISFKAMVTNAESLFLGEQEYLSALSLAASRIDRNFKFPLMAESTARLVRTLNREQTTAKVVVFSTTRDQVLRLGDILVNTIPECTLCYGNDKDAIKNFQQASTSAVLLTDQSSEEGLNLSFADAIVHLDLPIDLARIEQRIGRLDRYGRRKSHIRHRIHLPSDDETSPWSVWYYMVSRAFQVFHQSISDVQAYLVDLEYKVLRQMFTSGSGFEVEAAELIRTSMQEERIRQDEQYALDHVALSTDAIEPFVGELEESEVDEISLATDINDWMVDSLLLQRQPTIQNRRDPFCIRGTKRTLIPRLPWLHQIAGEHTRCLTTFRQTAVQNEEASLLRPGNPCVDALIRYTTWSDQGKAFITLRHAREADSAIWIGFKFCFEIKADIRFTNLLSPSLSELLLARRVQHFLPTTFHDCYVDRDGNAVRPDLLTALKRPYRPSGSQTNGDYNLGNYPAMLADILDNQTLKQFALKSCEKSRLQLVNQYQSSETVRNSIDRLEHAIARMRNRAKHSDSVGTDSADLEREIMLFEQLRSPITSPIVRLDSMGCFVVIPEHSQIDDWL